MTTPPKKIHPLVYVIAWLGLLLCARAAAARDARCDVSLSPALIDYGRLSRATMAAASNGELSLPTRATRLTIHCAEPVDMTLLFRGLPAGAEAFRFTDHGRFVPRLRDAHLDGEAVDLGQIDRDGDAPSRVGASLAWYPDRRIAPVKNGKNLAGRDFSAQVDIDSRIDERALGASDATRWSAQGAIDAVEAGSSRDLLLQADVMAGRCDVDVARHMSFGRLRSAELDARGASTVVPSTQSGELRVQCDAPMPFAFRVTRDEREGTAVAPVGMGVSYPDTQLFGLGKTPAGENVGSYVLRWSMHAASDLGELLATRSVDGGKSWTLAGDAVLVERSSAERVGYAVANDTTSGPSPVKAMSVTLDASIYIAPGHTLSLDDEIKADGLVTFEIIY